MLNLFKKRQLLVLLISLLIHSTSRAVEGIGGVATNLMDPVNVLANFIGSACLLLGIVFIFASIIKYVEHRRSPLMVPISTVLFLLIAGIILLLLPLLYHFTDTGISFWMFN